VIRRFIPLVILGFLSSVAAAQPRDSCLIIVDIGHSVSANGAMSARGVGEYLFNRVVGCALVDSLRLRGFTSADLLIKDGASLSPAERADLVKLLRPALLISIHHDSVQPRYLKRWRFEGARRSYCDLFRGFSLFYSGVGGARAASFTMAVLIGSSLRHAGFVPTYHHAERIPGENKELVDSTTGVYRFDGLALLKRLSMPAVLVECGVIVNRDEENSLRDPDRVKAFVGAIAWAVEDGRSQGLLFRR